MKIDVFIPCFIDQIYPQIGFDVIKVLEHFGCEINYNKNQTCCGQPHFNSGYWKDTKKIATKFLNDFGDTENIIVMPSASCSAFIKNYYSNMFNQNDKEYSKFIKIKDNIVEFTDFIVNYLKISNISAEFKTKVTYHDACSALREYRLKDEARILLNNIKGLEIIEMEENDVCCGFGGTFSLKFKGISSAMVEQKVQNAIKTGAEYIVSTEASCLLNIDSYIDKNKLPIKTIHIASILAKAIDF